jgi:hypothetical protein
MERTEQARGAAPRNGASGRWRAAWAMPRYRAALAACALLLVLALAAMPRFLLWNETRPGALLADPLLALVEPADLSWLIFSTTYGVLGGTMLLVLAWPERLVRGMLGYALLMGLRAAAMTLVPLETPPGFVPLPDPVVALGVGDVILRRDFFFSGHVSTLVFCALLAPWRPWRYFAMCGALVAGAALLAQHAHYTVDLLAAPFAAWLAHEGARRGVGVLNRGA